MVRFWGSLKSPFRRDWLVVSHDCHWGEKQPNEKDQTSNLAHTFFSYLWWQKIWANHFSLAIHAYHSFHCQPATEPKPSTARKGAKATGWRMPAGVFKCVCVCVWLVSVWNNWSDKWKLFRIHVYIQSYKIRLLLQYTEDIHTYIFIFVYTHIHTYEIYECIYIYVDSIDSERRTLSLCHVEGGMSASR